MSRLLPAENPTPRSHESRLTEDKTHLPEHYTSERRQGQSMKATVIEADRSPAGFYTLPRSGVFGTIHRNEDHKRVLLAVPDCYADLMNGKDPFLDSHGMPSNPHNTPASKSGRQSETGSDAAEDQDVLSPAKPDRKTLKRSSNLAASGDNALDSFFNGPKTTWKPPRPPKPSFLTDVDVYPRGQSENIRPSAKMESFERWEAIIPLPETPYRSLPVRTGKGPVQSLAQTLIEQQPEYGPKRQKQSWETRNVVPGRYFPRTLPRRDLELLRIPLNNPDMPFPAPIPTIDNLPLRREYEKLDWRHVDQCTQGIDDCSPSKASREATTGSQATLWRLMRKFSFLTKLAKHIPSNLVSGEQSLGSPSAKEKPTPGDVTITSSCIPHSAEPQQTPVAVRKHNCACVVQVTLTVPLLLNPRVAMVTAGLREYRFTRIAEAAANIVLAFIKMLIRWLLGTFHVEIAIEVKRI